MLEAIARIQRYTEGLSFEAFASDQKTIDAVVRNFEVMGEAARRVEGPAMLANPDVPWADIGDMRNILIHEYFGVDIETVWKTVKDDLRPLRDQRLEILGSTDQSG